MPGSLGRGAQIVEELDAVGPEHDRQQVEMTALASLGINRTDAVLEALPGNQGDHAFQEQFAAGLPFFPDIPGLQIACPRENGGGLLHTTSSQLSGGHIGDIGATMPPHQGLVQHIPSISITPSGEATGTGKNA